MANNLVKLTCSTHWSHFSEMLWSFYQNNYMADIKLICNDEVILMHKLILSIFSPKLKSMLDNDSCSSDRALNITDIVDDADLFENILEFLYKGEANVENVKLEDLKQAAKLLEISGLVAAIESVASRNEVMNALRNKGAQKRKSKPVKRSFADKEEDWSAVSEDGDSDDDWIKEEKKQKPRSKTTKPPKANIPEHVNEEKNNSPLPSQKSLSEYKKAWRQSRPIQKCPHCSYETRDKSSLKGHIEARHNNTNEKHTCDFCGKDFRNMKYFKRHVRQHTEDRSYKCDRCQYQTLNKCDLTEHLASVHKVDNQGNTLDENIKCSLCDFKCVTETRLKVHMKKHTPRLHKCAKCSFSAVKLCDLRRHVNVVHENLRPYQCDICGKCTKTKSAFNVHVRSHSGIKPYKCNICGQAFSGPEKCRLHMQRHESNEKPFICAICGHGCRRKDNLRMHMRRIHKIDDINQSAGASANNSNSQESSNSLPTTITPDGHQSGLNTNVQQDFVSTRQDFNSSTTLESMEMQYSIGHIFQMQHFT